MNSLLDIESGLRDYLMTDEVAFRISGSSSKIKIFLYEFNSDTPKTCIMIRDAGGTSDTYLRLDKPMVQVWIRSDNVDNAKTIMRRLDDELHQLGPRALSDEIFCLCCLRNTGMQRLDDPDNKLVQYFVIYNFICRKIT